MTTVDAVYRAAKFQQWYKNPASFFKDVFNMKPYPYQAKIMNILPEDPKRMIMMAAGGCLIEGTNILLANGTYKKIEDVKPYDLLLSYDAKLFPNEAMEVIKTGYKKVYRLKNKLGAELIATEDHPILTYNGYKKLNKFNKKTPYNSKALFVKSYDVEDLDISDDIIIFLSCLIAKGYYGNKQSSKITNNDVELLNELFNISKIFNVNPKLCPKGRDTKEGISSLISYLRNLGIYGKVKEYKRLPEILFKMSNRQIQLFLHYFIECGGSISFNKRTEKLRYSIYTGLSRRLAEDIKLLCNRIGVFPKIIERVKSNSTVPIYELRFYEYSDLFTRSIKTEVTSERFWIDEYLGEKLVYDIAMDGVHNYVAEGLIVHNTGKTKMLAAIALWLTVVYPKFIGRSYSVIIISGSDQQARYLYEYSKYAIQDNKILSEEVDGDPLQSLTKFKDRSLIRAVPNSLKAIQGKHEDCFDPLTEVLTEDGWKLFKDVTMNNKIATLNPVTKELEYHLPRALIVKEVDGKLRHIENKFVDLMVTQTHNLYIKTQHKGWNLHKADWSLPKRFWVKKDCIWKGNFKEYVTIGNTKYNANDFIEFMGYYISEGSVDENRIIIYQKNDVDRNKIKDCLNRLNLNYTDGGRDNKLIRIYEKELSQYCSTLGKYAWEKYIPKEYKNLCKEQLQILLDSLILGDGAKRSTVETLTYYTSSKQLQSDFEEIALKCEYTVKSATRKGYNKYFDRNKKSYVIKDNYISYIGKRFGEVFLSYNAKRHNYKRELVSYKGKVYCVDVPNHIIMVKRNGKACWAGNCVIVDEGALAGDFVIQDTLRIVSTSDRDLIILSGTPTVYATHFVEIWENPEKHDEWKRFHWSARDCPSISAEKLEEAKKLPEDMWQRFWEGNPFAGGDTLIPVPEIKQATVDINMFVVDPNVEVIAGLDWGWAHYTAFTVLQRGKDDIYRVIYHDAWRRENFEDFHKKIIAVAREYRVSKVYADSEDIGENQRLESQGLIIEPIKFNEYKVQMQSHLKIVFHQEKVRIPMNYQMLIQELRRYKWTTKEGDDSVTSLMLALWGAKEEVNSFYYEII